MAFISIDALTAKTLVPGFSGRFVHGEQITVGYIDIKAGSVLPQHAHLHEQITHVLEGQLKMQIDGQEFVVEPGKVMVIPSNVPHGAIALTDCKALDVFCPVREDYK
jgi:quercetin dioxygenase-like cupin family protein